MAKRTKQGIQSKRPFKRTRSDYRTEPEGTISHYLIHLYPQGHDYIPIVRQGYTQLNDTTNDGSGHYSHVDRRGFLHLNPKFEADLSSIPHSLFRSAIEEVRLTMSEGQLMVAALEWYQQHRIMKAKGISQDDYAVELGVSRNTVRRLKSDCITLVGALVIKRQRA